MLLNFAQYIGKVYCEFSNLYLEYNFIPKSKQVNEVLGKIQADLKSSKYPRVKYI